MGFKNLFVLSTCCLAILTSCEGNIDISDSLSEHVEDGILQNPSQANTNGNLESCGRSKACRNKEINRLHRIEVVKQNILQQLDIEEPFSTSRDHPSIDSPEVVALLKKYILNPTKSIEEEIRTESIIAKAKPMPYDDQAVLSEERLYFHFANARRDSAVKSANLWIYVLPRSTNNPATIVIEEYVQSNNTSNGNPIIQPTFYKSHAMHLSRHNSEGSWNRVSLTNLVRKWLEDPTLNHGIRVYAEEALGLVLSGDVESDESYKPYLEVELATTTFSRRKRSLQEDCSHSSKCCLRNFTINFREIGWDWIVFPHQFSSNICKGECSGIVTAAGTKTQLKRLLYKQTDPTPCCVPKRYSPLNLLYQDLSGNLVYTEVPDMLINECTCV